MPHVHDLIRSRLHLAAGVGDPPSPKYDLKALEESEWSPDFERFMRNRLLMGALRYGTMEDKRRCGNKWDLVGAVEGKIRGYVETGNTEYLVDAANYCLLEFECGQHPKKHFTATDDKDHCKRKTTNKEKMIHHPDMVRALAKSGNTIAEEMTGEDAHLLHMAVGVSGESGELLDAVKRKVIYRKPLDRENVVDELGDLEFYMEGLRQGLGITREETLAANIAKLGKRYEGLKYSDSAAQERADKAG